MNVILCYLIFELVNVPNTDKTPGDFRIWCARKNNVVAAKIAAIILPRSVCWNPRLHRLVTLRIPIELLKKEAMEVFSSI